MNRSTEVICQTLIEARRRGRPVTLDSGDLPSDLGGAYAFQAALIAAWGDPIAGWKIGRVLGEEERRFGVNRFVGPIFAATINPVAFDTDAVFPAIAGGSSALESELVAVLNCDVSPGRADWSASNVDQVIGDWRLGIEVAGCPVAGIRRMGALASVAVFGNNLGMLLGPSLAGSVPVDVDTVECESLVDGQSAGRAMAGALPGGPRTAAAFALNQLSMLGVQLRAGDILSTGAITGVHAVVPGQRCSADFRGHGRLDCTVSALP